MVRDRQLPFPRKREGGEPANTGATSAGSLRAGTWRGAGGVNPDPREYLTCRQQAIAGLLLRGLTNKRIAAELRISPHTVRDHISVMLVKCGAGNRVQLVALIAAHDIAMNAVRAPEPPAHPLQT